MTDLEYYRQEIDALDDQIQKLLVERFALTKKVGLYKKARQEEIARPEREQAILQQIAERYPQNAQAIQQIYQSIFAASRRQQK